MEKKRLFISHASEDKNDFVRPLVEALSADFEVWYDEYQLVVGDSLFESISKGLSTCDFGVVVLSKSFFVKKWPQRELNGFFALEEKDKKIILPIWKDVTEAEVKEYSPILADRVAANSSDGFKGIVTKIKLAISSFERGKAVEGSPVGLLKLKNAVEKRIDLDNTEKILNSPDGIQIIKDFGRQTIEIVRQYVISLKDSGLSVRCPKENEVSFINIWHGELCLRFVVQVPYSNNAQDAVLDVVLLHGLFDMVGNIQKSRIIDRVKYGLFIKKNNERFWKSPDGDLFSPSQLVDQWFHSYGEVIESAMGS